MTSSDTSRAPENSSGASAYLQRRSPRDTADRTTHASWSDDECFYVHEVVRYDKAGRWHLEIFSKEKPSEPDRKFRLKTVHDAVGAALDLKDRGGMVHTGKPGGGRFDYMYEAAMQRRGRAR